MSRIDEALRRAAQEQSADLGGTETTVRPLDGPEVTALAREPFPDEPQRAEPPESRLTRTRPSPRDEADGEPDSGQDAADADPDDPDRGAHGHRPRGKTLFERIDARLAEKVVADANMSPLSREQYRRLAGVLHDAQANNGLQVLMVASAVAGEGKTLTAANVALTLSDSYRRRVLLIDADLRKPAMHQVFRLNTASGLIDGLEAQAETKLVLRQVSSHLSVLPAGRPTTDPMAALTSDRMRRLLEEAKEAFDWVIIDTPPLMLLPDAHLLTSLVDGAIMVVRANSTAHEMVKRTADIIGRNRVVGVVLNHAEAKTQPGYGGYAAGYYLTPTEDRKAV